MQIIHLTCRSATYNVQREPLQQNGNRPSGEHLRTACIVDSDLSLVFQQNVHEITQAQIFIDCALVHGCGPYNSLFGTDRKHMSADSCIVCHDQSIHMVPAEPSAKAQALQLHVDACSILLESHHMMFLQCIRRRQRNFM